MSDSHHCVIVGGGVIGVACAYYLRRDGWRVTILERADIGSACSHANCGLISPSHVLPLAMPGAVGKTLKMMWKKGSPIYIKPRIDTRLWGWLRKFAGRCNHADMLAAGRARAAMLDRSRQLYDELIREESLECEWETRGCLFAYQQQSELDSFDKTDQLLQDEFGLAAQKLDGRELIELEPALKPGLAGAWYYEQDAHMRPDRLMSSWAAVLRRMGVEIRENCDVQQFRRDGGRVASVQTSQGQISGDHFVLATGALAPMLEKQLDCRLPIQPGKGYSITMPRPTTCPAIPLLLPEVKVAVTPFASGYRLGSTMEFSGYDTSLNHKRLDALRHGAEKYLHEPYCDPVEEEWYGFRPMTYDGVPIIGPAPKLPNVTIAAGHNMLGLSMAPATGELVANLMSNQPHELNAALYSIGRFN